MNKISRRQLLRYLQVLTAASATGLTIPFASFANTKANVVVIGGGFGGATCAKYLLRYDPSLSVTLIEPRTNYITCPFSNTILAGINKLDFITHNYQKLSASPSISLIKDPATEIKTSERHVVTSTGITVPFDRLIIAPGIDFKWDQIEGYSEDISQTIPHAWKAGKQTLLLREQLQSMNDGGVVIISIPEGSFRAPPAPYERASMIAYYLKKHKPKSKVLILDPKPDFYEHELYKQAWDKIYPNMIEWIGESAVTQFNLKERTLVTRDGTSYKGDVINIIPPQKAGEIAFSAQLTDDTGWCPVKPHSFESLHEKGIHIIGDACIAGEMAKAASSANTQAKACAAAVIASLTGQQLTDPVLMDVFYGLISKKYAISQVNIYKVVDSLIKKTSGGLSSKRVSDMIRYKEVVYAEAWYKSITEDAFN